MPNLNTQAVIEQFNHFQKKVITKPNFYLGENNLTITLNSELLEFSNASAGHSGFKSGARPVGIRVSTNDPLTLRNEIFKSVESLTAFIESSECDGIAYSENAKTQYIANGGQVGTKVSKSSLTKKIQDVGRKVFGKDVFVKLVKKYGKDLVNTDYKVLNLNEFALRYDFPLYVA